MTISMYKASVPLFIRALQNLSANLDKGLASAQARKIDPSVLVNMRLAPDMLPLSRQVQIATDGARGLAARLAGVERPAYEDNETTFDELQARIAKTIAFLQTFKPEQIDGSEERKVTLPVRGTDRTFRGEDYLLQFAIPNVFFHVTTAYAILRHAGVEIGKTDFLGPLPEL
ncbi:MAG: DUF1993 domain-containing protein [Rhodanobacteraceae bacterium]